MKDDNLKRTENYRKDDFSERYLAEINQDLVAVEERMMNELKEISHPPIFIVGVQRSGTTLLNQMIINNFDVAYPTNFIARFWRAPIAGSLIYKTFKLDGEKLSYDSDLGYTKGLNGPHEFGYFWRHWFPRESYDEDFSRKSIDDEKLKKQIIKLSAFNEKPLLFKNLHQVCFHIETLSRIFPNSLYLNIERDPLFVAQSTYESRLKLFGKGEEWFGLKPPQFPDLQKEKPIPQIIKQIYYTRKYIRQSLERLPEKRSQTIVYEDLVKNPEVILNSIDNFLKINGLDIRKSVIEPTLFESNNESRLNTDLINKFTKEIELVFNGI